MSPSTGEQDIAGGAGSEEAGGNGGEAEGIRAEGGRVGGCHYSGKGGGRGKVKILCAALFVCLFVVVAVVYCCVLLMPTFEIKFYKKIFYNV